MKNFMIVTAIVASFSASALQVSAQTAPVALVANPLLLTTTASTVRKANSENNEANEANESEGSAFGSDN